VASALLLANLSAWRFGLPMLWSHAIYQVTLMVLILSNAALTGGLTSAFLVFMGLVPLLAVFCMNRQWAIFWVVLSFFSLLLMFFAQINGYLPMAELSSWQQLLQSFMCIMVLEITQVILVFVYDSAHSQSMHALNRTNKRLASASAALQLADSHKDKFLAMVSHDMRTPLNAVIGYLGLMHDNKQLNKESLGFVASAQHAAAHLLTVINDLLDFSQIRLGQLTLHPVIDQAENGQQALDKMLSHVYALVLIDLVMPDIDGAQVAQHIRQHATLPMRDVPMVALTANVAQDALERCRLAGINHVLAKPFDRHMLIRVVRFFALNQQKGEL
jgi:CheY-like chemotaxis protein